MRTAKESFQLYVNSADAVFQYYYFFVADFSLFFNKMIEKLRENEKLKNHHYVALRVLLKF